MLLGARYYASAVGRFVTVDPVREGGNWYGYVGNNPVHRVDPRGLSSPPRGPDSPPDCMHDCYINWVQCKQEAHRSLMECVFRCVPWSIAGALTEVGCAYIFIANPTAGVICGVAVSIADVLAFVVCRRGCHQVFDIEWDSCDDARRWCESRC